MTKNQKKPQNNKSVKHEVILKDGETQLVQNQKGTYILVKVPMVKDNTYHHHPNHALTIKGVQNALTELSEWVQEGENETHQDMMWQNMEEPKEGEE